MNVLIQGVKRSIAFGLFVIFTLTICLIPIPIPAYAAQVAEDIFAPKTNGDISTIGNITITPTITTGDIYMEAKVKPSATGYSFDLFKVRFNNGSNFTTYTPTIVQFNGGKVYSRNNYGTSAPVKSGGVDYEYKADVWYTVKVKISMAGTGGPTFNVWLNDGTGEVQVVSGYVVTGGTGFTNIGRIDFSAGASTPYEYVKCYKLIDVVAPVVSLTSPLGYQMFERGQDTISLTADASMEGGTITKVEFYDGTTLLGTSNSAPYKYDWATADAGDHIITAKAYANTVSTVSDPVTITVSAPTVQDVFAPKTNGDISTIGNITITPNLTGGDTYMEAKVKPTATSYSFDLFKVRCNNGTNLTTYTPTIVQFNGGKVYSRNNYGTSAPVKLGDADYTYAADAWYTVKLKINMDGVNGPVFDVWLNNGTGDVQVVSGYVVTGGAGFTNIARIDFSAGASTPYEYVKCYRLAKAIEPDGVLAPLKQKSVNMLTGGADIGSAGSLVTAALAKENAAAVGYSNTMTTTGNYLWSDLKDTPTQSGQVTSSYQRLYQIVLAYNRPSCSELYKQTAVKNKILDALNRMHTNIYNSTTKVRSDGNWWDWEIGSPLAITKIVMLMYDDISPAKRAEYMQTIQFYLPNVRYRGRDTAMVETGANLGNKCEAKLWQAIVENDVAKLSEAVNGLRYINNFSYSYGDIVDGNWYETDGFYPDGSFIQHIFIPYTGGYGQSYLSSFANMISVLSGTEYAMESSLADGLCEKMELAFYPMFYNGLMMDMVRGREIVKSSEHDMEKGSNILATMLRVAQGASDKYKTSIGKFVSSQINADNYYSWNDATAIMTLQQMLPQFPQIREPQQLMTRQFNSMARTVQKNTDYAVGISMSSKRTGYYESVNGQNRSGWFTGFGMMYVYDKDKKQFGEGFWNGADMTRLPGTTVSRKPLALDYKQATKPTNDFAGGANVDSAAVSGMELVGYDGALTAKKSWFLFDNKVIALGSNINNSDTYEVQTIIDNKRIYGSTGNKMQFEKGTEVALNADTASNVDISGNKWGYIANNEIAGIGTGYIFDDSSSLYAAVYTGGADKYGVIGSSSGVNPTSGKYAYTILPNRTKDEVVSFANNKDYQILQQDENAHAVRSNGLLGINFWTDGAKTIDYITADKKATIASEEKDGVLSIGICDTTQSNVGSIIVELDKRVANIAQLDSGIEVLSVFPTVKLKIDTRDAEGKVFRAKFNLIASGKQYTPYVKILRPANGEGVLKSATNRIVVDTYCANDAISKVEYYCNGTKIGESTQEPYYFDWQSGGEGEYEITAKAYNSRGEISTDSVKVWSRAAAYTLINKTYYDFVGYDTKDGTVRPPKFSSIWLNGGVGTLVGEDGCFKISQNKAGTSMADSSRLLDLTMTTGNAYRVKMNVKFSNTTMTRNLFRARTGNVNTEYLIFSSDGKVYGPGSTQIMNYEADKWYEVIWEMDLRTAGQGKYSLIINGTKYKENVDIPSKSSFTQIDHIRFNQSSATAGEGSMYIKNIETANMIYDIAKMQPVVKVDSIEDVGGQKKISITARDFDYGIESVEFYVGGNLIGSSTKAPYSANYTSGAGGSLSIKVKSKNGTSYDFDGGSVGSVVENIFAPKANGDISTIGNISITPNLTGGDIYMEAKIKPSATTYTMDLFKVRCNNGTNVTTYTPTIVQFNGGKVYSRNNYGTSAPVKSGGVDYEYKADVWYTVKVKISMVGAGGPTFNVWLNDGTGDVQVVSGYVVTGGTAFTNVARIDFSAGASTPYEYVKCYRLP